MALRGDAWLLMALALGGLMLGQDAGSMGVPLGVPLHGAPVHGTHTADLPPLQALPSLRALPPLRSLRDVLPDDSSVCVSETEERLLCTERSRFNLNTFGLRFGKRQGSSRTSSRTSSRISPRTTSRTNPVQQGTSYYHLPVPAYGPRLLPT